jgi:hypothetical protein
VGPIANLSSPLQLFLNLSRIQIRTQFFCGSHFLPLLGPPNSFLPFSLSLLHCFSASLSLLSAISRPLHPRRQTKKYPTKQKQTEKYPTKQKQTEMQKIILSVLSDGQIHGHFTAKFIFPWLRLHRVNPTAPSPQRPGSFEGERGSCLRRWRGSFEGDPREAASGAGAGYGGERGRERGGEDAVPFLGCAPAPIREGRTEEEKDRNGRGGICLVPGGGKIKRKGGRGGYVGGGGKKGERKKNNNNNIIIIKFKSRNQNYVPNTIFFFKL